ncbi:MAG: isoprenyl transferase [Desulfobacteraceae bacterium]|nr:isoprenyl transferase [Desulfobacteraceae bacterium]
MNLDPAKIPSHVAIIMDGNGRWAKKRLMNRIKGHEKGADTVRAIVRCCRKLGIKILTLYAFSTENWLRPKAEVTALMGLLKRFLDSEEKELLEKNIRLNTIGQTQRLPQNVRTVLTRVKASTQDNDGMLLNLALSYGGRSEIVEMVRKIGTRVADGELTPKDITEETIVDHLYTRDMADPDLLIRTSGEMRLSNFLLWQIAYSEFLVTDTLWPDFSETEFISIITQFQNRERRFGRVLET